MWDEHLTTRPFGDIVRMKKLKSLWLPWVILKRGKAATWKFERSVMYWVSRGLSDLEDICFQEREWGGGEGEEPKVVGAWVLEKTSHGNFQGTSISG